MADMWTSAMNKGDMSGVVLLDLRKAFDLIDHQCLIKKLEMYRCSDMSLRFFTSYLTDRTQKTAFKGTPSSSANITVGVPQGSILGPLFFILFMNDMPLHVNNNLDMYADDSTVHASGKTIPQIQQALENDMMHISSWCNENKMVINTSKTKCMLITTQQRRNRLQDPKLSIKVDDQMLQQVESDQLLGVTVDQNLCWRDHIDKVCRKITSSLALFRRIKNYLPHWSRIMFYNAYILPHMDFCITLWGSCSDIARLLKLQKQAARIILNCDVATPSVEMFHKLKWLPIVDWVQYRKANIVFKALNGKTPEYISDMFIFINQVHARQTRQSIKNDLYVPPRAKLNTFRNAIRYSGASIWNNLPNEIRDSTSSAMFKTKYLRMFLK
jgi:hypothetical protein